MIVKFYFEYQILDLALLIIDMELTNEAIL